ncbi:hypothetical protein Y032_0252g225 [Ancylostoma ceylanicum]|uniref:DNA-directed DNA polymerase n=1 Tax=Ancylostoma ceylanicum TaxID=53326 RepID=A0A016SCN1_9BILA|nr:hypothetical protein Y032_0252g225 [Ancylostoma ceylanicum]
MTYKAQHIVTVPELLHRHLFQSDVPSTSSAAPFHIELPTLKSRSLQEHFRITAEELTQKYKEFLEQAALFPFHFTKPSEWILETGWIRYSHSGVTEKVEYPLEDVFFFDVETCVQDGQLPTLAVALSAEACHRLVHGSAVPTAAHLYHLIPVGGSNKARVVIGHNVGYDRARTREPYEQMKTAVRFMDTMSMAIPMFGMADHQVVTYETDDSDFTLREKRSERWRDAWDDRVCRNSLLAVHQHLYRDDHRLTKESKKFQEFFVKEDMNAVRQNFQVLVNYCADDNLTCSQIFKKLWPEFQNRFPHPATLYGMLNIGNAYLPINENWELFFNKNESTCNEQKEAGARALITAAKDVINSLKTDDEGTILDAWLFDVDWSYKNDSEFPEWFFKLFSKRGNAYLDCASLSSEDVVMKSAFVPLIFGMTYGPYPLHRSRSLGWGYLVPNPVESPTSTERTCLLRTLQEYEHVCEVIARNKAEFGDIQPSGRSHNFGSFLFYQLSHPLGAQNVGDPLGKHFLRYINSKVLRPTRHIDEFFILLEALKTTKFWTNYTKRFESELPVWYESDDGPRLGAIAPAIVPAGTVSRRSVHKLWVTLTNESGTNRIGTGIKSLVQAPEGCVLVGADVDSQEQWLAGLFGDASHAATFAASSRHPGLTPFSNMMLAGSKAEGTDLHTVVANQLQIDRGQAKALNYARMYGAGEAHASKTLAQAGMDSKRAAQTARDLFKMTKGTESSWKKLRREVQPLLRAFVDERDDLPDYLTVDGNFYIPNYDNKLRSLATDFEQWVTAKVLKKNPTLSEESIVVSLYESYTDPVRLFSGGYESATFNFLEMQTHRDVLRTPVLDCRLSDSLSALPEGTPDRDQFAAKYKRSVMNWLVQSSAVDFLHLLLVCMEWLCSEYSIHARFVISIHDEVRYLCSEDDAPRLGLALMLSNMYVRSFISCKMGIEQLPLSVAFFSQVDCDKVLRKEVNTPCFAADGTPLPNGVSWTISDLLQITGGRLSRFPKSEDVVL